MSRTEIKFNFFKKLDRLRKDFLRLLLTFFLKYSVL